MPADYYTVLGVARDADESTIKRAYRQLARKYHPDVATDKTAAESHFKEINEAYEVLSDAQKRANYDRFGHAGVNGSAGEGGFGPFGGSGIQRQVRQTPHGQFVTQTTCSKCSGDGQIVQTPCVVCRGRGTRRRASGRSGRRRSTSS